MFYLYVHLPWFGYLPYLLTNVYKFVYKFICGSCKADYIGCTKQHLSTRIKKHLKTDKKSHVYKQLNESQWCKALSNADCFSIVLTQYSLSIKESMFIGWQKPALN